jgi:hypothetical protein
MVETRDTQRVIRLAVVTETLALGLGLLIGSLIAGLPVHLIQSILIDFVAKSVQPVAPDELLGTLDV